MMQDQERKIADQVGNVARASGYEVTVGGNGPPHRRLGWFRDRDFVPDLVLRCGNRTAIVEIKARPVVTHDVFQMQKMRSKRNIIGALICVPDSAFYRTAPSVRHYADNLDVAICSFSDVERTLAELLENPRRKNPTVGHDL